MKKINPKPVDLNVKRRIFLGAAVKGIDVEKRQIRAYASTNDWDRYGERFEADAFKGGLDDFQKNPVLLFAHDYASAPIGKIVAYEFDSKGLILTQEFATTDKAEEIFQLYVGGFMSAFSVGFKPVEVAYEERSVGGEMGLVYKKALLLENSAVPVPANPGAVVIKGAGGKEASLPAYMVKALFDSSEIPQDIKMPKTDTSAAAVSDPDPDLEVKDSNATTMGQALSLVNKAIKRLSGHEKEYLSHDDKAMCCDHLTKAQAILASGDGDKSIAPADMKASLQYLIDLGKTVKAKVTDEGTRGLLIQATNVCRELVFGPGAASLEGTTEKMTQDEQDAMVREFELLGERIIAGGVSDEDRKEFEKIGELIDNLISGK